VRKGLAVKLGGGAGECGSDDGIAELVVTAFRDLVDDDREGGENGEEALWGIGIREEMLKRSENECEKSVFVKTAGNFKKEGENHGTESGLGGDLGNEQRNHLRLEQVQ
jgi:hypothetical protein